MNPFLIILESSILPVLIAHSFKVLPESLVRRTWLPIETSQPKSEAKACMPVPVSSTVLILEKTILKENHRAILKGVWAKEIK